MAAIIFNRQSSIVNRQSLLLIGLDEAGYGPKLGPLCHGYCAIRCRARENGPAPDLWQVLHPSVMRHPASSGSITVDDSKVVYTATRGLTLLAQGVGAFLDCLGARASSPQTQAGEMAAVQTGAGETPALPELYQRLLPESDRSKLAEDAWGVARAADGAARSAPNTPLRKTLEHTGTQVLALGARALSARHFNAALELTRNKADVSWRVMAAQLAALLKLAAPGEKVFAVIDRQGGRKFYAARVGALFPAAFPRVERETPADSTYRIETSGVTIRISFLVAGERQALPVALGSMAAKLARELCMHNFNAFFKEHAPELRPTAGYAADAARFLRETAALRERLGIADRDLVREL